MFDKPFEKRMSLWRDFRISLESSADPIQDTIDYWNNAPIVTIAADPWDQNTWPDPWEMIQENIYCEFVKILAICYTLQLTTRFSQTRFEINITQDRNNSETKYLLIVDRKCIGYDRSKPISIEKLPKSLEIENSYAMPSLQ